MMLNVREVARLLAVSEKTLYRWIARGEIPAYKVGEVYRFNRVDLMEWATQRKIKVDPSLFVEPTAPAENLPALHAALQAGGIHYQVPGPDKAAVLQAIVRQLPLPDSVDRKFLLDALLARENLGTTAIGDGLAIPHVRNPLVVHVDKPMLALCFLEHPVDFAALDGRPVHTIFLLLTPAIRAHLHLLSRLSYALHAQEVRPLLDRRAPAAEILEAVSAFDRGLASPAGGGAA